MKILASLFVFFLPVLIFAQGGGTTVPGSGGGSTPQSPALSNPLKGVDTIFDFVTLILNNVVIPIGSVVIVFMIIYTGFRFVMARGNADELVDVRRMFLYVVIGAAILLGATVISAAIQGTICDIVANNLPGCQEGPRQLDGTF